MPALTKEQKAARARAEKLDAAGLTEEQFAALSEEQQAAILAKDSDSASDTNLQINEVEYVQMVRDSELYPEPHTAEVHPDEVVNYRPGGWTEA